MKWKKGHIDNKSQYSWDKAACITQHEIELQQFNKKF